MKTTNRPAEKKIISRKENFSDKKKIFVATLTQQVSEAQYEINKQQAIVNALTEKLTHCQDILATAEISRSNALANSNQANALAMQLVDLKQNADAAMQTMSLANEGTKKLIAQTSTVFEKLSYCTELISKMTALVVRQKGMNALIPDELVTLLAKTGHDANEAISVLFTALDSVHAAQLSNCAAESAAKETLLHASGFDGMVPGIKERKSKSTLQKLCDESYKNSKLIFDQAAAAVERATSHLSEANLKLDKAQVASKSLQASLAAAKAAITE